MPFRSFFIGILLALIATDLWITCNATLIAKYDLNEAPNTTVANGVSGYCQYQVPAGSLVGGPSQLDFTSSGCLPGGGNCINAPFPGTRLGYIELQGMQLQRLSSDNPLLTALNDADPDEFSVSFWLQINDPTVPFDNSTALSGTWILMEQVGVFQFRYRKISSNQRTRFQFDTRRPDLTISRRNADTVNGAPQVYNGWDGSTLGMITFTAGPSDVQVYVNGELYVSGSRSGGINVLEGRLTLFNEADDPTPDDGVRGIWDDIYFFDHQLSATEVEVLYNRTDSRPNLIAMGQVDGVNGSSFVENDVLVFTVPALSTIQLNVNNSGDAPLGYHWEVEQTLTCEEAFIIDDASSPSPTFEAQQTIGDFTVDACAFGTFECSQTSAVLRVLPLEPNITSGDLPLSVSGFDGEVLTLEVTVFGVPTPEVQWEFLIGSNQSSNPSFSERYVSGMYLSHAQCTVGPNKDHPACEAIRETRGEYEEEAEIEHQQFLASAHPIRFWERGDGNATNGTNITEVWFPFPDESATSPTFLFRPTLEDDGLIVRARVFSPFGSVSSTEVTLTITSRPIGDGADGDGGDENTLPIALGTAGPALGITLLMGCCLCLLVCCCCCCLIVVAASIARIRSKDNDLIKLPKPDYREVAFGDMLEPKYSVSKSDQDTLTNLERWVVENFAVILVQLSGERKHDVSRAMLFLMHLNGLAYDFITEAMQRELTASELDGTLFRANSLATKLFTSYARVIGVNWLWRRFAPIIYKLHYDATQADEKNKEESSEEEGTLNLKTFDLSTGAIEVNPDFQSSTTATGIDLGDEAINIMELHLLAQKTLKIVLTKGHDVPLNLVAILSFVRQSVMDRADGGNEEAIELMAYRAVGGFFFLRYICSSLTAPQVFGLLDCPPHPTAQRTMLLLGKLIQNLANNTLPGMKEDYMAPLNDFVTRNVPVLSGFYERTFSCYDIDDGPEVDEPTVRENALAILHNHFSDKVDDLRRIAAEEGIDADMDDIEAILSEDPPALK